MYFIISISIIAIVIKLKTNSRFRHTHFDISKSIELTNKQEKMYRSQKSQGSKMLLAISVSFVVFNFPYFVVMLVSFMSTKMVTAQSETEFLVKLNIKKILILLELLQIVNFSLTGFLFFATGTKFRVHFYNLFCFKYKCY